MEIYFHNLYKTQHSFDSDSHKQYRILYSLLGQPSINIYCNIIDKMLREQNLDVDFESLDKAIVNFHQEENTSKNYFKSQFEIFDKNIIKMKAELLALNKLASFFLNDDDLKEISPNKIRSYKRYNYKYFIPWAEKNILTKTETA